MADVFELQLALDLPDTLPPREVALLRWHLGHEDGEQDGTYVYEYPLWGERGPARRVGGLQLAELRPSDRGYALTVRQEIHPDSFTDLRAILQWLGPRTTTVGPIGHLRFYEEHVPSVLVAESGTVSCVSLRATGAVKVGAEGFPYG
ncbi:hypothetical protein ABZ354_00070 [Streptomyces sp. NPDC005925]|uniref:hypothetical protein n=1 Tax=Streptomyces sp. NPDC005925 TaxID=3157172 RepID=UPI0033F4AAFA